MTAFRVRTSYAVMYCLSIETGGRAELFSQWLTKVLRTMMVVVVVISPQQSPRCGV